MAVFRMRGNNYYLWTVFWSGASLAVMTILLLRRCGFSTDYARIRYLMINSDLRFANLECGAPSENPWLPPHLRLDMVSYLDTPDVIVAAPPSYDLSVTEKELVVALVDVLPEDKKADIQATFFGLINTRTMAFSYDDKARVLDRRIGVSQKPEDLLDAMIEDEAAAQDAAKKTAATAAGSKFY